MDGWMDGPAGRRIGWTVPHSLPLRRSVQLFAASRPPQPIRFDTRHSSLTLLIQRLLVVAMQLRFGHVLLLMTSLSAAATAVAFTSVLHAALLQSGFSASLLRHPVNTEAIVDFLSQVPPQKLLFLFLTHSSAHVLLMLMLAANAASHG